MKRENGKVWIDNVKGFDPGEYASSVHGAQARILQTLGEPLTYDDLVGYSAFAFRANVHEAMCPSAGHPCCGFMCVGNGFRALPWEARIFEAAPSAEATQDRAAFETEVCAAIRQSIDRGVPVHYGSEEDGLIIGYADEGRRWLCLHPYWRGGRETFWHDEAEGFAGGKWPWGIVVWTGPKPPEARTPERELLIAALEQAVEMWETEKREAYYCGDAAYEHWLRWLHRVDTGAADNAKGGMQGNGWCYDVLVHCRRIAGRWLEARSGDLGEEPAEYLREAAAHYRRIAELCMKDLDCPWSLAPGPGEFEDWTSEQRHEQIARLEEARCHDRAAIEAIRKALQVAKAKS